MKILYVTTVGGTMGFFRDFIEKIVEEGNTVDIAANENLGAVSDVFSEIGCRKYLLSCARSVFNTGNLKAVKEIRKLVNENNYDIVHCHTPIAAFCTRLACIPLRKKGVKVIYTAHGFHFYKGAPLKNWLVFYPAEWLCAFWTDVLITINKEDYTLAKKHMHAKKIEYVPGVGIDLQKFSSKPYTAERVKEIRSRLGLTAEDKLLLSLGELNENKNFEAVIRALKVLDDKSIHYAVAGEGKLHDYFIQLARELGVLGQLHLLGFRNDAPDLYKAADLYINSSLREGLPVSVMEAIASGTPVICSNIRGNADLVNAKNLFNPSDYKDIADKIRSGLSHDEGSPDALQSVDIGKFGSQNVSKCMKEIYKQC